MRFIFFNSSKWNYGIFFSILFSSSSFALAGDDEIPVKSTITGVTVFLTGAQVTHNAGVMINAGTTNIKFEDLPLNIDKNSIQAKGGGNFTILSVNHQVNYLKDRQKPKEITLLEDSVKSLQKQVDFENNFRAILAEEESLLYANKSIGNKDIGVDALDLQEMADFFRKRLIDIRTKILDSKEKEKKMQETIDKLNNQLNELNARRNRSTSEIIVEVSSKAKATVKIQLSYMVFNAGWTPLYDVRSTGTKNISLAYKANVFQNTGVDWEHVNLTLSTGNPVQGGIKPEISPWILRFQQPVVYYNYGKQSAMQKGGDMPMAQMALEQNSEMVYEKDNQDKAAQTTAFYTQVTESQVATEFIISIPYSVPSDGKKYVVEIQNYNIKAGFNYYAAPKLDKDAFLLAKVAGWEEFNLLPGEANIFNEETYVGKSFLNTASTNDTLDLSFGRDKSVVIKRTHLKDYTSKKIIGSTKTETHGWEIEVKNTKKDTINIVVEDQIPVSSDKEITVEAMDTGKARFDEISGKLSWKLKLAPAESRKLNFTFSVKYPKDKYIPGL